MSWEKPKDKHQFQVVGGFYLYEWANRVDFCDCPECQEKGKKQVRELTEGISGTNEN